MNAFEQFIDEVGRQMVVGMAMTKFYEFTLVLVRMAGLMAIGPIFGQKIVPGNIRVLLVISMAFVITPTLGDQSVTGFQRLDADEQGVRDGKILRDDLPERLHPRFDALIERAGKQPDDALTLEEFRYHTLRLKLPSTVFDYAWVAVGEFALGLVLGLGVLTILSGLQLAGELIDQQTGMSMGKLSNPSMDINASVTGQFLFMLGVTILAIMEPINGHLLMVAALVETFQTLPVGEAYITSGTVELLQVLMQQSLVLGIQVAAPMLACMSLVALTMGFLGHSVPQLNILVIGFPIRASVSILILAITVSGAADAIVIAIPQTIDALRQGLTGLP